ncbi:MAG: hypothetical protein ACP5OG_00760 [Candidatus Nanoarchaeia archaeon]
MENKNNSLNILGHNVNLQDITNVHILRAINKRTTFLHYDQYKDLYKEDYVSDVKKQTSRTSKDYYTFKKWLTNYQDYKDYEQYDNSWRI